MVTFEYLPEFERRAKALAKKYRSFEDDYNTFLDELERNPYSGTPLGGNTYKYRMAIASKGKGKSGGARVITYNLKQTEAEDSEFTYEEPDMSGEPDKEFNFTYEITGNTLKVDKGDEQIFGHGGHPGVMEYTKK